MSRESKYKPTTFRVPPELVAAVAVLSKRTRIPQAAFIREGLALVVRKYAGMLGEHLPADIDEYAEPAHINAHNARAWKEVRRPAHIPDTGVAQAPPAFDAGLDPDGESVPPPPIVVGQAHDNRYPADGT